MIVLAVTVPIKPEARDEATRVALRMAEATRREPGCRRYGFYADVADPCSLLVFEEWQDQEALDRHFETPHMKEFQASLPAILAGELSLDRYLAEKA